MKRLTKLFSLVLVISMLFCLVSCGNGESSDGGTDMGDNVMRYEDYTLNESEYMFLVTYVKNMVVSQQQYYLYQYTGTEYGEADILAMPADADRTIAQYIEDYTAELAQQMLIMEKLCDDAGIEITSQETLDTISNYIADIEYAYGGEDRFEIALSRLGFSRSGIERFQKFSHLYELIYEYRYGENGVARIPEENIYKTFTENYLSYDAVLYSYVSSSDGSEIVFDYTDDEIADYFADNYVKVRHILYKTVDSSYNALPEDEIAEKKAKADAALAAIESGEKTFDSFAEETEDSGLEYTFTYGQMVKAFESASFEMEVGDVRCVETEYGYHIIEKLALADEDLNGTVDEEGNTKGGMKLEVAATMSAAQIRAEALETLEKLQSGELESYPEEDDDIEYYIHMDSAIVDITSSSNSTLASIFKDAEAGVYFEREFSGEATYILRKLEFSKEDITSEIYSTIEEQLAVESFAEYTQSFYDSVEINKELLEKFDVLTIPMLEEEFYITE